MKNPRPDNDVDIQFKDAVFRLKKKFCFPYSDGHIKDRANGFSAEHIKKVIDDISFAEVINENHCVGICNNEPIIVKKSMKQFLEEYINKKTICTLLEENMWKLPDLTIDISKINEEHPMYEVLKNHNGILSACNVNEFLYDIYCKIFSDKDCYKKFRNYIQKNDLVKNIQSVSVSNYNELLVLENLVYSLSPFLETFNDDRETLSGKWKNIAERWFSAESKKLTMDLLLIQGYTLLDMHPLFKEKLKKGKNTLDNIIRDGNHCFFASKADYFVTEDAHTREKTMFLYKVYGIKTKVVSEKQFLEHFDFI